jgi:hypothetical protein
VGLRITTSNQKSLASLARLANNPVNNEAIFRFTQNYVPWTAVVERDNTNGENVGRPKAGQHA